MSKKQEPQQTKVWRPSYIPQMRNRSLGTKRPPKDTSLPPDVTKNLAERNTIEEVPKVESDTKIKEKGAQKPESESTSTSETNLVKTASDTNATPRKRGRKRKEVKEAEAAAEAAAAVKDTDGPSDAQRLRPDSRMRSRSAASVRSDTVSLKNDTDAASPSEKSGNRPTRASKQQSRYYKGPDKVSPPRRAMPTRMTRNRM